MTKRIAVMINHLGIGGAEHHVVDFLNEAQRKGVDVYLFTLAKDPAQSFKEKLRLPEEKQILSKVGSPWNLKQIYKLSRDVKNISPDILVTHSWYANTVGRMAGVMAGVSRIISVEHNINIEKTWKCKLADFILQFFSYKIAAVSKTVKKSLMEDRIIGSKIAPIRVAIDLKEILKIKTPEPRVKYGIPKEKFVFLYGGSLTFQKNLFNIIKAFYKAERGILVIAGNGQDRGALENLVKELKIESKVFFLGAITDLGDLMRKSNALIFPSRWEGLGLVAAEAIMLKLPPIVSKYTASGEMVKDGVNGLTIDDPENVDEIAGAMRKMADDEELRNRLVSNCGKLPFDLSIEHYVDEFLKLIN